MPTNFFRKKNAPTAVSQSKCCDDQPIPHNVFRKKDRKKGYILASLLRGKVKELCIDYYVFLMGVY